MWVCVTGDLGMRCWLRALAEFSYPKGLTQLQEESSPCPFKSGSVWFLGKSPYGGLQNQS